MEYQLRLFANRTARVIKSRPKVLIIPFLVSLLLFTYFFAVTNKTFSRESEEIEHLTDVYEDGIWYQVLTTQESESERYYTNKNILISVDGEDMIINTDAVDLQSVFAESSIQIGEFDKVEPNLYSPVSDGMNVKIVRVTKVWDEIEEIIPHEVEYIENSEELLGSEIVIQEGSEGKKLKVYEKEFEDGELVSSVVIEERVLEEPVNQIIEKGTKVVVLDTQYGVASYYYHPKYPGELITAHNTYPMGSKLRVTNLDNGKSVVVTVVDRGIHSPDRVVDLSTTAFKQIASTWQGLANVKVELLVN